MTVRKTRTLLIFLIVALIVICGIPAVAEDYHVIDTPHFSYFLEDGVTPEDLSAVKNALENSYNRILSDLQPDEVPVIRVFIYASTENLKQKYGPGILQYFSGMGTSYPFWDSMAIVAPHCFETYRRLGDPEVLVVAIHEFAHCVSWQVSQDLPRWLSESVAQYESGMMIPIYAIPGVSPDSLPSFAEISGEEKGVKVYHYGYSLCEYIVAKWGKEGLRRVLRKDGTIEALGVMTSKFEVGWHDFIRKRYFGLEN